MIALLKETRLALAVLAEREDASFSTIFRWTTRGVNGIRLESFMVGHRRFTTEEAFLRFIDRLNPEVVESGAVVAGGAA